MTTVFEIPTGPSPRVERVTLNGVSYVLRLTYENVPLGGWTLEIGDSEGTPILCGVPLVTGCDLLAQYKYLGIGGKLFVYTDGDPGAVPTFDGLGSASHLYFELDS